MKSFVLTLLLMFGLGITIAAPSHAQTTPPHKEQPQ
jgi:hypothetical protein